MGLKVCSLASGSKGNCIFVGSEETNLLIDAGVSVKKVVEGLDKIGVDRIDALLVTHEHSDHIRYVREIAEHFSAQVYAHRATAPALCLDCVHAFDLRDFYIRDITVSPIELSHDVFCVGYNLFRSGSKVSVVTDTGIVKKENLQLLEGSETAVIEANHDERLLMQNPKYSAALKQRILSDRGHLSNDAAAALSAFLVRTGTKNIVLAHLSEENNYPELALDTVQKRLAAENLSCKLTVASQRKLGEKIG